MNRAVCKQCIDLYAEKNVVNERGFITSMNWDHWYEKRDGYWWDRGTVHCPAKFSKPPHRASYVKWKYLDVIPAWCPFVAEHAVSENACVST